MKAIQFLSKYFHRIAVEEEGQSMVFGAISMFLLFCFIALVFNIGDITSRKIQIQNAADAAAYSGALVEANSLNSIAWINDGMAYIYYHMMRYTVDYITFATLNEFTKVRTSDPDDMALTDDKKVGIQNIGEKFKDSEALVKKWIPKMKKWLTQLSQMEQAIARATPFLVKQEIIRIARANGAEAVSMIPDPADSGDFPTMDFTLKGKSYLLKKKPYPANGIMNPSIHRNFTEKKQQVIMNKLSEQGRLPQWWDKLRGYAPVYGYSQIRTCWNTKDLEHTTDHQANDWLYKEVPTGHWHDDHDHYKEFPNPIPPGGTHLEVFINHKNGHKNANGHPDYDEYWNPDHHFIHYCPTCSPSLGYYPSDWDGMISGRGDEIGKTDWAHISEGSKTRYPGQKDIGDKNYKKINLSNYKNFALPLAIDTTIQFQKSGITVLVWRSKSERSILSSVFKNHDSGFFAIAKAQVAWKNKNGIVSYQKLAENNWEFYTSLKNLYVEDDQLEEWFTARLVSLRSSGNLSKMLTQFRKHAKWYVTSKKQSKEGIRGKLKELLKFRKKKITNDELEALIWH